MTAPQRSRPPASPSASPRPTLAWMWARPERVLAFGLGTGLLRPGPGTWGTMLGWLLWAVALRHLPSPWVGAVLVVAFVAGCWAAQRCGEDLGVADYGGINWDEIVAIWVVLWLVPQWVPDGLWTQLACVLLFRGFDIAKPPPVNWFDARFKNGLGVMLDDLVAAAYAVLVMVALAYFGVFT